MQLKKKILILGGTEFVGRQLVEELIKDQTNEIYLFNRGVTNPDLFPTIKRIIGDRETSDIEKINQYKWDYIIDFSSYFPNSLRQTILQINKDVKKYIYISTISVYSFQTYDQTFEITEEFPKRNYEENQLTEPSLKYYGEKKSACEDVLNDADWLNTIILRPSIIYGKYDPTDRLYYWLERIKKNRKIIVPAGGEHKISLTYSADLVKIIINCLHEDVSNGTYNCVTHKPMKIIDILHLIKNLLLSNNEFKSINQKKLKEEGLSANDFPFWFGGHIMFDNSKIEQASKIAFTPFNESIESTIDYYDKRGWPLPNSGLPYEEEEKLIGKFNTLPD